MERQRTVKMKGEPLELAGTPVKAGDQAPDFVALDNDLGEVRFSSLRGKVVVISSVPSLDTPVCDLQTRRFNQEAASLGEDVTILTLSMDLPFAQKRWCAAAEVEQVVTLSDHRDASFGESYGLLIKDLRLLARAVLVVDRAGLIRYFQLVEEVTQEPDYDGVIEAVRKLI